MPKKWVVEFKPKAFKELKSLDNKVQTQVFHFLDRLTEDHESPRVVGLALQDGSKKLWRYRVGDYRLICAIESSIDYSCLGSWPWKGNLYQELKI